MKENNKKILKIQLNNVSIAYITFYSETFSVFIRIISSYIDLNLNRKSITEISEEFMELLIQKFNGCELMPISSKTGLLTALRLFMIKSPACRFTKL